MDKATATTLFISYGFAIGTTQGEGRPEPDPLRLVNDLVGPLDPEGFMLQTSKHTEDVLIYPVVQLSTPPDATVMDGWEEATEVSFYALNDNKGTLALCAWDDVINGGSLAGGEGYYRVLACARGRAEAARQDPVDPQMLAEFRLYVWPAPEAPPIEHKSIGFHYEA